MSSPLEFRRFLRQIFAESGLKIGKNLASDFLGDGVNLREKNAKFFRRARKAKKHRFKVIILAHFHLDNPVDILRYGAFGPRDL